MTELEWFKKYAGYYKPEHLTREEVAHLLDILPAFDYDTVPNQPKGSTLGDLADKIITQAKAVTE